MIDRAFVRIADSRPFDASVIACLMNMELSGNRENAASPSWTRPRPGPDLCVPAPEAIVVISA